MKKYNVKWQIQVEANSAEEAAELAREIQLEKESEAVTFDVDDDGSEVVVDLLVLPLIRYINALKSAILAFDNRITFGVDFDEDFSEVAFDEGLNVMQAVERYFSANSIELSTLKPLKGKVKEFHAQVRELTRPYATISAEQQSELLKATADFYETSGGLVVTFGGADGGFALMPLDSEAADRIKRGSAEQ